MAATTKPAIALTTISGGINRLRLKGGADKNSLFDLLNGYVTQSNTVKVREGTFRNANIAQYAGAGQTKGLLAYQDEFHIFSSAIVDIPPGYQLHVLNYPANQSTSENLNFVDGTFAATTQIGTGTGYGLVSGSSGFAKQAIINPQPGGDVGSVSPTTFLGVTVEGFFQALGSSTNDPNEVYLVTNPALPSSATLSYVGPSGLVTVTAGTALTTNLGLAAGYAAYALGTGAPTYDPSFGEVSLLYHFEGTAGQAQFVDSSGNGFTATVSAGPVLSTMHKEFGASACYFNGSGYFTLPLVAGGPLDLGTSTADFTIEFWMFAGTQSGGTGVIVYSPSPNNSPQEYLDITFDSSTGVVAMEYYGVTVASANSAVALSTGTNVAFVRHGGTLQCYINGVASGTSEASTGTPSLSTGTLLFGAQSTGGSEEFAGYIDEFRITKGSARYTSNYTPATSAFPSSLTLTYNNSAPFLLKEIHFAAAYLGGIYVVAEFNVTDTALLDEFGSVFHYWIQSSISGDNANEWIANTDYEIGDVVIPTSPNGLTYIASRALPANPVWAANTIETVGNIVEPTVANGFKYTVTNTLGATPTTGETEPTWPLSDGATVLEASSLANDQTFTTVAAAAATPTPTVPARYEGLYSP